MAEVSPGPSVRFHYKNENPVAEHDTSSTNNIWFYNLQFVAITKLFCIVVIVIFCYNRNVRTDPATLLQGSGGLRQWLCEKDSISFG